MQFSSRFLVFTIITINTITFENSVLFTVSQKEPELGMKTTSVVLHSFFDLCMFSLKVMRFG